MLGIWIPVTLTGSDGDLTPIPNKDAKTLLKNILFMFLSTRYTFFYSFQFRKNDNFVTFFLVICFLNFFLNLRNSNPELDLDPVFFSGQIRIRLKGTRTGILVKTVLVPVYRYLHNIIHIGQYRYVAPVYNIHTAKQKQGCGSESGLDLDSMALRILILIGI
jgi:hypothetical protein